MANKVQGKNLFEPEFDHFEFDDVFLLELDAKLKKNSLNKRLSGNSKKVNPQKVEKSDFKGNENNENVDKNAKYYDLPLFIEDLNDSDFFDFSKTEKLSSKKKVGDHLDDEKGKQLSTSNSVINCPSPILGCKTFHKNNISSSTPLKPSDDSGFDKKPKENKKDLDSCQKSSQFDYLEADLFDDWDLDENKCATQKDTVTFSQALKLIEEAEIARESSSRANAANESIDMLTGEVVSADMHMFKQSFEALEPIRSCNDKEELSDDSVIIVEDNSRYKPSAAQKLNFDSEKKNYINSDAGKEKAKSFGNICFSSDDDFDIFSEDLLGKLKKKSKCGKADEGVPNLLNGKNNNIRKLENDDLNESSVDVLNVKRRKRINVIESDTTEDSPSPKFRRQRKPKIRNQGISQDISVRDFCELEAEVTDEGDVSSDEIDEEDEYEQSFLDEETYDTQNCSADMTAKYLQSVKDFARPGKFKIPAKKPYNPKEVFSQAVEETNTDYQIDSFCVNDVEEETKTDLSDLEIAEKILEMDKKKRKKRFQKLRKT